MFDSKLLLKLRQVTGAGFLDCKKALIETNGDFDASISWLREKNIVKSISSQNKLTGESLCGVLKLNDTDVLVGKVSCQTDFALNSTASFVLKQIFLFALRSKVYKIEDLLNEKVLNLFHVNDKDAGVNKSIYSMLDINSTCQDYINNAIALSGENIIVSDFKLIKNITDNYVHGVVIKDDNISIGKIVVTISFGGVSKISDQILNLAKNLCMHAAFHKPISLTASLVPQDKLDEEREIKIKQNNQSDKKIPEDKLEMVLKGQIKKFAESISFEDQLFIMDNSKKVKDVILSFNKEMNSNIFIKYCSIISNKEDNITLEKKGGV